MRKDLPISFKIVPEATQQTHTTATPKQDKMLTAAPTGISDDVPVKREFTATELTKFTSDEDIKELLYVAQTYLEKTFHLQRQILSSTSMMVLVSLLSL